MRSGPRLRFILVGLSLTACAKDRAQAPAPPAAARPGLATVDAAPVMAPPPPAVSPPAPPVAVAVAMPGPDDIKAALALRCSTKKAGSGCTDAGGAVVIPFVHDQPVRFKQSGLALVKPRDRGWSYVDARGQEVLEPFVFDNGPDELAEGRARVVKAGKVGFIDEEWRLIIPPQYDAGFGFVGGIARVCVGCDPRIWSAEAPPEASKQPGRELWIDHFGREVPRPRATP